MEAKEIKRAIKKHGEGRKVSYDDKYFTHNMPEFMCIAKISFKAGQRDMVEFVIGQEQDDGVDELYHFVISKKLWRKKLKEWEVNDG